MSTALIPSGSEPISLDTHRQFIEHMAALHAAYWGFRDHAGLFPFAHHYVFLTPAMAALEAATPHTDPVPPAVAAGWRLIDERHPLEARRLRALTEDPWLLVTALLAGPHTLLHGDWKLGNLGRDGSRTILLDWDRTGEGSPLVDLAWYVAVNCARLPETKEDTIGAYRAALESAGIETGSWWDAQLAAALTGAFLQLCWDKAEDDAEFGWWTDRLAALAAVAIEPSNAYEGVAAAWARGPAALYDKLATLTIESIALELAGAFVLDVGAGTGALCRALRMVDAIPVAVDMSRDMLGLIGDAAALAIVGDMCALPVSDDGFDAAVSGFAISHVDNPEHALAEMRRVVRPGGRVIAAVFGAAPAGASKDVIDEVAGDYGYVPPTWYVALKTRTEPRSNTPALLKGCAESAGLKDIDIADVIVDSGLDHPESITAYRTGLAHMAPFVASLPDDRRVEFINRAVGAVRERGQPVRPRLLVLSSRVPA